MQVTITEFQFLDATRLPQQQLRTFFHDSFEVRLNGQHRSRYVCQKIRYTVRANKVLNKLQGPLETTRKYQVLFKDHGEIQGLIRTAEIS